MRDNSMTPDGIYAGFTNDQELWTRLDLGRFKIALWNSDIQQKTIDRKSLDWQNVDQLYIVGTGGFTTHHGPLPCKISYFDARIDPSDINLVTHLRHLEYVKNHYISHCVQPQLQDSNIKSTNLMFDVLLGLKRPHREFAYHWINSSPFKDRYFLTYYKTANNWQAWEPGYWDEEKQPFNYSGNRVPIPGDGLWNLSLIIPARIYNKTFYTLVAETNGLGPDTIVTEKLWKPLLCRRPFVVLANQYYLRNLRSLGFQTFHGIIDETYDTISDDHDRWHFAMQQCDWLCAQNPHRIIDACDTILAHNYDLAMQDHNLILEQKMLSRAYESCQ